MYAASAGLSIATQSASTVFYPLTDHNRQPLVYSPQRIEQSQRMANGTMRKMVIANKAVYDISWTDVPSATQVIAAQSGKVLPSYQPTVDGNYGAGFMKAFYESYVFQPVWIKLTYANDNATGTSHSSSRTVTPSTNNYQILKVFITDFKYTINKRLALIDYVDVSLQFTEV